MFMSPYFYRRAEIPRAGIYGFSLSRDNNIVVIKAKATAGDIEVNGRQPSKLGILILAVLSLPWFQGLWNQGILSPGQTDSQVLDLRSTCVSFGHALAWTLVELKFGRK